MEERPGASEQPGRPRCPGAGGSLREPLQCLSGEAHLGASGSGLDEIGQHEWGDADAVMVEDASRRAEGGVIPARAELEHGEREVGVVDADALAALVRVAHRAASTGPRGLLVRLATRRATPTRERVSRAARVIR